MWYRYAYLYADGDAYDRLGDGLANSGQFNRRHNGVLRKTGNMFTAVAVGSNASIILGDKDNLSCRSWTVMLNAGLAVDLADRLS